MHLDNRPRVEMRRITAIEGRRELASNGRAACGQLKTWIWLAGVRVLARVLEAFE